MRISELVSQLQDFQECHGDLDVYHEGLDGSGMGEVTELQFDAEFGRRNKTSYDDPGTDKAVVCLG